MRVGELGWRDVMRIDGLRVGVGPGVCLRVQGGSSGHERGWRRKMSSPGTLTKNVRVRTRKIHQWLDDELARPPRDDKRCFSSRKGSVRHAL